MPASTPSGTFTNLAGAAVAIASSGFVSPTIAPNAGTTNVQVYYVPVDTSNYNSVTNPVTVSVGKGTPLVQTGERSGTIEVEQVIASLHEVAQVAVIGVPDDKWGEAVKAVVVLKPAARGNTEPGAIVAWAREKMAAYKAPREVRLTRALPRNATGKLLRRTLR